MKKSLLILTIAITVAVTGFSFKPAQLPPTKPQQLVEITTIYGSIIIKLYNETPLHRDNFIKHVQEGFYDSLLFHLAIPKLIIQAGDPRSKYPKAGDRYGNLGTFTGVPQEIKKQLYHKRGALGAPNNLNNVKESDAYMFYIVQGDKFTTENLNTILNTNNLKAKQAMLNAYMQSDSVKAKMDDYKLRGDTEGLHKYLLAQEKTLEDMYAPHEFSFTEEQAWQYIRVGGAPHLDGQFTVFGEVIYGMNVVDSIASLERDANNRPLKDIRLKARLLERKKPAAKPSKPVAKPASKSTPKPAVKKH